VDPFSQYPFLRDLLKPFWLRRQKTMALVIAAISTAGQARSFAIATCMKRWLGVRLDSAVNRFYRLLRNINIDYIEFAIAWAKLLAKKHLGHLIVSIDWTEWHHELRMLTATVVTGKRAIPLFAQAFKRIIRQRSQNARENIFLRLLVEIARRAGVSMTILCDRGFRRASWIILLLKLQVEFVVRLKADVCVFYEGKLQALSKIPLPPGKVVDLGVIPLRSDGVVEVRVIGYRAPFAKEGWWLATNIPGPARRAVQRYDRRMTIEEQFRDTKGKRFGVKLFWTQFRDPEALARFAMFLGVALLIWTVEGARAAYRDPSLRMVCRKKGPRQSFVTIGLRIVPAGDQVTVLTVAMLRRWLMPPAERGLGAKGIGGAK
jgi:hypothetical protein